MRRMSSLASGGQREPHQIEAVAAAQAETRAVHDAPVTIDKASPVIERVALIEVEELILDANSWIACRGDRRKKLECAAEFAVKDGTGQVVAAFCAAAQKEAAPIRSSAS